VGADVPYCRKWEEPPEESPVVMQQWMWTCPKCGHDEADWYHYDEVPYLSEVPNEASTFECVKCDHQGTGKEFDLEYLESEVEE